MILGIDASNIRAGGGLTHLVELLGASEPAEHGFAEVIVWGGRRSLSRIKERRWLVKSHQPTLDRSLPFRAVWQRFRLTKLARMAGCDVLFVPGGAFGEDFRPMVTFAQNLLPFEWNELGRFGWSWMTLRLVILRVIQTRTFRRADGLIFLTGYAREVVVRALKDQVGKTTVIPHGVNERFGSPPRGQSPISCYSVDRPFHILYVSGVYPYKHHWTVVEAVRQLRATGVPVLLDLVGPASPRALKRLRKTLRRVDPTGACINYLGSVPYEELPERYARGDLFVFASTCESFGQVVLEAMSAGLPIACSDRSAMPEVLGDAGVYFDPENSRDIARALQELIDSTELRTEKARAAFGRAQIYSWKRCATDTFGFLASVAQDTTHNGCSLPS